MHPSSSSFYTISPIYPVHVFRPKKMSSIVFYPQQQTLKEDSISGTNISTTTDKTTVTNINKNKIVTQPPPPSFNNRLYALEKTVYHLLDDYSSSLSNNSMRKNYFLAACYLISPSVDINEIDSHSPFGGLIGVGDSCLDSLLNKFKILRLHAILHDAAGFMKRVQSWTWLSVYIKSCSNMFQLVLDWTRNRSFVLYIFGTQISNYFQSS